MLLNSCNVLLNNIILIYGVWWGECVRPKCDAPKCQHKSYNAISQNTLTSRYFDINVYLSFYVFL